MNLNETNDAKFDALRDEARAAGKDYVIVKYPTFNAQVAQCCQCDWIEFVPKKWQEDDAICAELLQHTATHRKGRSGSE